MINSNKAFGESKSLKEITDYCKTELDSNSEIKHGAQEYNENEIMDLKCETKKYKLITIDKSIYDLKTGLNAIL